MKGEVVSQAAAERKCNLTSENLLEQAVGYIYLSLTVFKVKHSPNNILVS
jgi:hypothetical protein